ncbi:MAG: hypothetical protein HUJ89_02200 [Bacteroidales bacterium]|nr:hypothetical protein [Bacteroidales bacterium]
MKKKLFAVMICLLAAAPVFGQKFNLGIRGGYGLQADAEYYFGNNMFVEGRFGMGILAAAGDGKVTSAPDADFNALIGWRVWEKNGMFINVGVGVEAGGRENIATAGGILEGRFGYEFPSIPLTIAADWSPMLGAMIFYGGGESRGRFNTMGLCNFGLSAFYRF